MVQRTRHDLQELLNKEFYFLLVDDNRVDQVARIVFLREKVEQAPQFVRVVVTKFPALSHGVPRRTHHPTDLVNFVEVDLGDALAVDARVLEPVE